MAVPALAAPIAGALANILLGGLFRPKPPKPPTPPLALPGGYAPSTQLTGPEPTPPPAPNPMGPILSSLVNAGIGAAFAPTVPGPPAQAYGPLTTAPAPGAMGLGPYQMDPALALALGGPALTPPRLSTGLPYRFPR